MRLVIPSFLHLALAPDLDCDGEDNLQAQECGGKEIPHFIDLLFLRTKRPPRNFWHCYVRSMKKPGLI
jgi:hypothetical protein